jgi:hypothetical protein
LAPSNIPPKARRVRPSRPPAAAAVCAILHDNLLCGTIPLREQVGSTVKRLHREGAVENIGAGRARKWKLAGT